MPCPIGADFYRAMVATAPGDKVLEGRRAPICEELHPPYDIKLVFVQKITLFLVKSTETAATRAPLFDSNMHHIVCRLGLCPRPHRGSLQRSPDTLAVFRGPMSTFIYYDTPDGRTLRAGNTYRVL